MSLVFEWKAVNSMVSFDGCNPSAGEESWRVQGAAKLLALEIRAQRAQRWLHENCVEFRVKNVAHGISSCIFINSAVWIEWVGVIENVNLSQRLDYASYCVGVFPKYWCVFSHNYIVSRFGPLGQQYIEIKTACIHMNYYVVVFGGVAFSGRGGGTSGNV